jgi:hypothetical protein
LLAPLPASAFADLVRPAMFAERSFGWGAYEIVSVISLAGTTARVCAFGVISAHRKFFGHAITR